MNGEHTKPVESRTEEQRFQVGEIVLFTNRYQAWTSEGTVVEGPGELPMSYFDESGNVRRASEFGYYVDVPSHLNEGARRGVSCRLGPHVFFASPHQLRKIRPPREELGDWELIPWARPTKEKSRG